MDNPPREDVFLAELMGALDVTVFLPLEDGNLQALGDVSDWLRETLGEYDADSRILKVSHDLGFLDSFLVDARAFWADESGRALKSGLWSQVNPEGKLLHLEATAVRHADRRVLLVELMGIEYEERREVLQRAREGKLHSYHELVVQQRMTERLWSVKDELEEEVSRRTRDLRDANQLLKHEIEHRLDVEERVARLNNELAHASRVNAMGEMASAIAHELNQPIGAARNYLQGGLRILGQSTPDISRVKEALEKGSKQTERAGRIVQNLREMVAKGRSERVRSDLNELIKSILELLEFELRRSKIDLRLALDEQLPKVTVDPVQVQQVLLNLVKNAIEATAQVSGGSGRITIESQLIDEARVAVMVTDSGPGIDGDLERLFEPYFSTKETGMGMGLAICRSIADSHAGCLVAERATETGLVMKLVLPTDIREGD